MPPPFSTGSPSRDDLSFCSGIFNHVQNVAHVEDDLQADGAADAGAVADGMDLVQAVQGDGEVANLAQLLTVLLQPGPPAAHAQAQAALAALVEQTQYFERAKTPRGCQAWCNAAQ
jgi:hypothetical protein